MLEYDDVMNIQREVIYKQRRQVLDGEDLRQIIRNMIHRWIDTSVHGHLGEHKHLDAESYQLAAEPFRGYSFPPDAVPDTPTKTWPSRAADALVEELDQAALAVYDAKEAALGAALMRELERVMMLRVVDEYWMDHIDAMDELRKGIRPAGLCARPTPWTPTSRKASRCSRP